MSNTVAPLDTSQARKAMIDSQLRTSGVNEEYVLARMLAVPREDFLPEDRAAVAYIDRAVRLDGGALASPLFYGKLMVEAAPTRDDRVLVVEGGTGYLSELLRPLVGSLETMAASEAASGSKGTGNCTLIVIDGAIAQLPDGLSEQLDEGGRIVTGLVQREVTRLAAGRKIAGNVSLQAFEDLGIPVLEPFAEPKSWSFS